MRSAPTSQPMCGRSPRWGHWIRRVIASKLNSTQFGRSTFQYPSVLVIFGQRTGNYINIRVFADKHQHSRKTRNKWALGLGECGEWLQIIWYFKGIMFVGTSRENDAKSYGLPHFSEGYKHTAFYENRFRFPPIPIPIVIIFPYFPIFLPYFHIFSPLECIEMAIPGSSIFSDHLVQAVPSQPGH